MKKYSNQNSLMALLFFLFILRVNASGQNSIKKHVGTYSDHKRFPSTVLKLKSDGSFYLKELDDVFFMRSESFENTGKWISSGDTIILNPHLDKLNKGMELEEESIENFDSIRIELNYYITEYGESDSFNIYEFLLTTYEIEIDNKIYYVEGMDPWKSDIYKKKNIIKLDSNNSFCLNKKSINSIEVYEYVYGSRKKLDIQSSQSNYFRININHEFDENRNPRSRKIIVKNNKVYMQEYSDEIDTSLFAIKLKKRKS